MTPVDSSSLFAANGTSRPASIPAPLERRASFCGALQFGLVSLLGLCDAAPAAQRRSLEAFQHTIRALPADFVLVLEHHEDLRKTEILGWTVDALPAPLTVFREANLAHPTADLRRNERACENVANAHDRGECARHFADQMRPINWATQAQAERALAREGVTSRFLVFKDPQASDIDRAPKSVSHGPVVLSMGYMHGTAVRKGDLLVDECVGISSYVPQEQRIDEKVGNANFDALRRLKRFGRVIGVWSGELWGKVNADARAVAPGMPFDSRSRCHAHLRAQGFLVAEVRAADMNLTLAVSQADRAKLLAAARAYPDDIVIIGIDHEEL